MAVKTKAQLTSSNNSIFTNNGAGAITGTIENGFNADIIDSMQLVPIVVSSSRTAVLDDSYVVVASATFTDPTPVEGKGFKVLVRNGTATVGGTGYSTAGTVIYRIYHSGSWANYVFKSGDTLPSSTAGQTFQNQAGTVVATDTLEDSNEDDAFNIPTRTIYNEQGQPVFVGANGGSTQSPPSLQWGVGLDKILALTPGEFADPEISEIYTLTQVFTNFSLSDPGNYDIKGFNYVSQDLGVVALLYIKNNNPSATLTLKNLDGSVDPDQQIQTIGGNDLIVNVGEIVCMIYDGNFEVVSVSQPGAIRNFKLNLSSSDIISGGTFDIPQLAAPGTGFAWQIQSASLKYDYNSFANLSGEVQIFADGAAASQFTTNNDPLTLTASWWGNMVSSQMNNPSNTDVAIVENAKMTVVLGGGSLSFDGTATVYGTATLITV